MCTEDKHNKYLTWPLGKYTKTLLGKVACRSRTNLPWNGRIKQINRSFHRLVPSRPVIMSLLPSLLLVSLLQVPGLLPVPVPLPVFDVIPVKMEKVEARDSQGITRHILSLDLQERYKMQNVDNILRYKGQNVKTKYF